VSSVCHRPRGRGSRQVVPGLGLPTRRGDPHQPLPRADATVFVFGLHPGLRGPHYLRPLGTRAEADLSPPAVRQGGDPIVGTPPRRAAAASPRRVLSGAAQPGAWHVPHLTQTARTHSGPTHGATPTFC